MRTVKLVSWGVQPPTPCRCFRRRRVPRRTRHELRLAFFARFGLWPCAFGHPMAQRSKAVSIGLLAICELAALAVWFSATAIVPSVLLEHALTQTQVSMFTSSVQIGFVTGTLLSAVLGLADRVDPRFLFMVSTQVAAAANASILLVAPGAMWVYVARFITGVCMAGVYPIGM